MLVEDFNFAEPFQASLISFESECWEFSFRRTILQISAHHYFAADTGRGSTLNIKVSL